MHGCCRARTLDRLLVADMRSVAEHHGGTFDVVITCENSIPHLLTDAEILTALEQFSRRTAPGGLCLITVCDYSRETREGVQVRPPILHRQGGTRLLLLQVWEFDGPVNDLSLYVVEDEGDKGSPDTCLPLPGLCGDTGRAGAAHGEAGSHAIECLEGAFFPPVLLGRRPPAL